MNKSRKDDDMTPVKYGKFITVEGGEGAGKSTQLKRMSEMLTKEGIEHITTREPGGTIEAEEIRDILVKGETGRWDPVSEVLLHFASRREHVQNKILPALEAGKWVLCDRFVDSSMAYQGYGYELGCDIINKISDITIGDLKPDLTLLLDIPVAAGMARTDSRTHDENRYERMEMAFHERLRNGFLEIAKANMDRCVVIDASLSVDVVWERMEKIIESRLLKKVSA